MNYPLLLALVAAAVIPTASQRGPNPCLKPPFRGITVTNEIGDIIGPVDPNDWGCIDAEGTSFAAPPSENGAPLPPPTSLCLREAYPNPARGETTLPVTVPAAQSLTLTIHRQAGEPGGRTHPVKTLMTGMFQAGYYTIRWNLTDDAGQPVRPGIYRAVLTAGNRTLCGDIEVPE